MEYKTGRAPDRYGNENRKTRKKRYKIFIENNGICIGDHIFKIGGNVIFLQAGEIHYFRLKPEEWNDRLSKLKLMGLNAVSTYVYWNFHELREGQFDFRAREKDLDMFLHLCEDKHFYIIIRPGPWICSELLNGGIPQWLIDEHPKILALNDKKEFTEWKSKKAVPISYLSPTYLKFVERYLKEVGRIIRRHLYPHGGVILIQPDNEPSYGFNRGLFEVDYNPVHINFYRNFLKSKYENIITLNRIYGRTYFDFESIMPPTEKTFKDASFSENPFTMTTEYIRLLDWMESKEEAVQEYIRQICYFFRKSNLMVPYFANISTQDPPMNPRKLIYAYKTKLMVGDDLYIFNLDEDKLGDTLLEKRIELMKARVPHFVFTPELGIGWYDKKISPMFTHILIRLAVGHGVKGLSYYMAAGGTNPVISNNKGKEVSYSSLEKTMKWENNDVVFDNTGRSYDFQAPITEDGKFSPKFPVIQLFSRFLNMNGKKLVESRKVYDEIAIIYYTPYSRVKFNAQSLGYKCNYRRALGYDDHSELLQFERVLNKLGLRPKIIDIEIASIEELLENKVIVMPLFNFLSIEVQNKLINYLQNGGKIISFMDIPFENEYLEKKSPLFELYNAIVESEEYDKEISVFKQNYHSFGSLYSYAVKNIEEESIIARGLENHFGKIYGFKRKIKDGEIYHLGFFPYPDEEGIELTKKILINCGFNQQKTLSSSPLSILRQRYTTGEEFIFVSNLSSEDLNNISISLYDIDSHGISEFITEPILLDDLLIPKKTSLIWTLLRKINSDISIELSTSELNKIYSIKETKETARLKHKFYFIEGYHFEGSRNILKLIIFRAPIGISINGEVIELPIFDKIKEQKVKLPIDIDKLNHIPQKEAAADGLEQISETSSKEGIKNDGSTETGKDNATPTPENKNYPENNFIEKYIIPIEESPLKYIEFEIMRISPEHEIDTWELTIKYEGTLDLELVFGGGIKSALDGNTISVKIIFRELRRFLDFD
ncbi:MAG: beta-galactosidase [Promethearchaeota archaeon]